MAEPLHIRIEILGDAPIDRLLMAWSANALDLTPAMREVLDLWAGWTRAQFTSRGAEMGTPWRPLKAETIRSKRRQGYATPTVPLVASGRMRNALRSGWRARSDGAIRRATREGAEFGVEGSPAMFHQGRDRSATNPVPRRPIFELDEAKRRLTIKVVQAGVFDR